MPKDKHQSLLEAGNIAFTGHSQALSNHPKWQVCNIDAISQKSREGFDFLQADKHKVILQVDNINLGGHGNVCSYMYLCI